MFQEKPISSVAHSTIRVSVQEHPPAEQFYDWHFHRHCEILMTMNGGRTFDTEFGTFELAEGDIIFLGRQSPHRVFAPRGHGSILLQFDGEDEFFMPVNQGNSVVHIPAETALNKELRPCLLQIAQEHIEEKSASDLYIRGLTMQIVAILRRAGVLEISRPAESADLRPAMEYIHTHFASSLSLDEVSKVVHMTPAHFCRRFKSAVGVSFLQYLNRLRIQKGEELLADLTLPVSTVATMVGFCSSAYFSETFRKIHSRSPREYRKLLTDRKI